MPKVAILKSQYAPHSYTSQQLFILMGPRNLHPFRWCVIVAAREECAAGYI